MSDQVAVRVDSEPRRLTDETGSLWYCERCSRSGAFTREGADVYSVFNYIEVEHKAKAPECDAPVVALRIVRPESWLADAMVMVAHAKATKARG